MTTTVPDASSAGFEYILAGNKQADWPQFYYPGE